MPEPLPQFDYLRKKAKEESGEQLQQQQDALQRRFASLGQGTSGAAIKTQQMAAEASQKQSGDVQAQIGFAEQQEQQRQKEVADARNFQTSERVAAQDFSSKEANTQRLFSKDLFNQDMAFKQSVQAATEKFAGLDNAFREKEFSENQFTNEFNRLTALGDNDAARRLIQNRGSSSGGGGGGGGSAAAISQAEAAKAAANKPNETFERVMRERYGANWQDISWARNQAVAIRALIANGQIT